MATTSQPGSAQDHISRTFSDEEKRQLYRDGYVIVRNALPPEVLETSLQRIRDAKKGQYIGGEPEMTDLINASAITPILHEAMGNFDPPIKCQIGIRKIAEPADRYNNLGYHEKDMPYFAAESHVDGSMSIAVPQEVQDGTPEEIYNRYIASGPKGDIGRSPEVMGHNMVPLFEDPEMTLGLGSFTAFVFVALTGQMTEGCGQTALIPGSHHEVEKFFRWQREQNGHLGPEGPGWPRLDHNCPNRCGLIHLPDAIREKYIDETSECTPDGRKWPRPTQVLMKAGDACIAMYNMAHTATRNQFGKTSRKTMIFRIRNKKRQPNIMVNGVSDHPDRGQMGEWLEFEEGNNPWERSKDAMCNMWDEWQGMQDVVAEERAKEASQA